MTEVLLTRRARKDFDALDPPIRDRIARALHDLESDPLGKAKKLSDPRIGTYRLRVGDWRVIFDLEEDAAIVLRIGHRREIYRGQARRSHL